MPLGEYSRLLAKKLRGSGRSVFMRIYVYVCMYICTRIYNIQTYIYNGILRKCAPGNARQTQMHIYNIHIHIYTGIPRKRAPRNARRTQTRRHLPRTKGPKDTHRHRTPVGDPHPPHHVRQRKATYVPTRIQRSA